MKTCLFILAMAISAMAVASDAVEMDFSWVHDERFDALPKSQFDGSEIPHPYVDLKAFMAAVQIQSSEADIVRIRNVWNENVVLRINQFFIEPWKVTLGENRTGEPGRYSAIATRKSKAR